MSIGMVTKETRSDDLHARRFEGIVRPYPQADVDRLRGSIRIAHTLAEMGARRLWELLHTEDYVNALGALTGNQAVQMVRAGLKAIYLSGWQVAADANTAGQMYPDQSLYPVDSVPTVVRRINQALRRADQIEHAEGKSGRYWMAPIVADAEAGFGGPLNAFELMKAMIEAGAAGVHFEDQLASREEVRPHGRQGAGPDLPVHPHPGRGAARGRRAVTCRRSSSPAPTPTAPSCSPSDVDPRDRPFIAPASARRRASSGSAAASTCAIARGLAYAPYADLIWCETSTPDLGEARRVRRGDPRQVPGQAPGLQLLALVQLEEAPRRRDHRQVPARARGDGLQVPVRHAGRLPRAEPLDVRASRATTAKDGMAAYCKLQQAEFAAESTGYTATATSARWAPATSTRSPRSSPAAPRRRWRSRSRPRPSSSSRPPPRPPRSPERWTIDAAATDTLLGHGRPLVRTCGPDEWLA